MTRALSALLLAALAAPALAAEPGPVLFGPSDRALPEAAKFRVGRPTGYATVPLAFSADGKTLAAVTNQHYTGGIDVPVDLWDARTGAHLHRLRYHKTGVMAAAFSPNGETLATSGIDNRLRFWDAKTGKDITKQDIELTGHGYNVTFSADGKRLLVGSGKLELYDVATQKPVKKDYFAETAADQFFHTATWSPKGKYVAAGCDGKGVRVWDAATGNFLYKVGDRYTPHRTRFAFSADDKLVLFANWPDSQFKVFDAATGTEEANVKPPEGERVSEQVQFAREMGRVAWVVPGARPETPTIAVSDATGAELKRFDVPAAVMAHLFSYDGSRLAVGGQDGSLRVYDSETGKVARTLLGAWSPVFRAAYADGGKLLRTVHATGHVHDFDANTGKHLNERALPLGPSTHLIAVSADGSLLASATDAGACTIWNLDTGAAKAKPKGTLYGHREPWVGPFPLPPQPVPPRPAPCGAGDCAPPPVPPGAVPPPLDRPPGPPQFVAAFSPDGKLFAAVTGHDDAVTVWDAATGAERHAIKVAKGVGAVALSADGSRVFVGPARSLEPLPPPKVPRPGAKPAEEKEGGAVIARAYDLKTGKEAKAWKASPGEKREGLRFARADVTGLHALPAGETLVVVESQVYIMWPPPPIPAGGRAPEQHVRQVRVVSVSGKEKDRVLPGTNDTSRLSASPDGKAVGFVANDAPDPNKPARVVKVVQVATGKAAGATLASGPYVNANDVRSPQGVSFRSGGADLAVCLGDGTVLVVDAAKLKEWKDAPGGKE